MSTVPEIEKAIRQLTAEELAVFRAWFAEFDAAAWDQQFEADVAAGKLDALAKEAIKEFHDGHCTDL
jgi:alkylhydroperoxidase family enzyme